MYKRQVPFLFAITNYIDKFLLSRYQRDGIEGGLFLVSTFICLPVILLVLIFQDVNLLEIDLKTSLLLMLQGAFTAAYLFPYFIALKQDEPTRVVPLHQLIPVFSLVIEYLILGTVISVQQFIGMAIIIIASFFISSDMSTGSCLLYTSPSPRD